MMIKIRPIVAVLLVLFLIIPLSVPAFATATPAPTGGGGHSSGGGGGRRGWLDTFAPGFVDDGSNLPVGDTASGAYLSLDHVDAEGNYWFQIHGFKFLEKQVNGSMSYTIGDDITATYVSSASSYGYTTSFDGILSMSLDWSSVRAPINGIYSFGTKLLACDSKCFPNPQLTSIPAWSTCPSGSSAGAPPLFFFDVLSPVCVSSAQRVTAISGDSLSSMHPNFDILFVQSCSASLTVRVLLRCVPAVSTVSPGSVYDNKIGSITGDVVVIGDNNKVTKYDNCTFVDEVNKKYYCPTTNIWTSYNSYSYDYSNFTYNFVTDSGNTTINYGDEYISYSETVNNVTNVYNYYYSAPGTGGGTGGDSGGSSGGTNWLSWLKDRLQTALGSILDAFFEWLAAVVKDVLTAIWEFFKGLWTFLSGFLDGFAERVKQFFGYMSSTNGGFFDFSGVTYNYGKVISSPGVTS